MKFSPVTLLLFSCQLFKPSVSVSYDDVKKQLQDFKDFSVRIPQERFCYVTEKLAKLASSYLSAVSNLVQQTKMNNTFIGEQAHTLTVINSNLAKLITTTTTTNKDNRYKNQKYFVDSVKPGFVNNATFLQTFGAQEFSDFLTNSKVYPDLIDKHLNLLKLSFQDIANGSLYGVMDIVNQDNLIHWMRAYLSDDRTKLQYFLLTIIQFALLGAQYDVMATTYIKKYHVDNDRLKQWEERFKNLALTVRKIDSTVLESWDVQADSDLDKFLYSFDAVNNKEFVRILYSHLSSKFPWRYWIVLRYNRVRSQDHAVGYCRGYHRFGKKRYTVVASVPGDRAEQGEAVFKKLLENESLAGSMGYKDRLDKILSLSKCSILGFATLFCADCNHDYQVEAATGRYLISRHFSGSFTILFG